MITSHLIRIFLAGVFLSTQLTPALASESVEKRMASQQKARPNPSSHSRYRQNAGPKGRVGKTPDQYHCAKTTDALGGIANILNETDGHLLQAIVRHKNGKPSEIGGVLSSRSALQELRKKEVDYNSWQVFKDFASNPTGKANISHNNPTAKNAKMETPEKPKSAPPVQPSGQDPYNPGMNGYPGGYYGAGAGMAPGGVGMSGGMYSGGMGMPVDPNQVNDPKQKEIMEQFVLASTQMLLNYWMEKNGNSPPGGTGQVWDDPYKRQSPGVIELTSPNIEMEGNYSYDDDLPTGVGNRPPPSELPGHQAGRRPRPGDEAGTYLTKGSAAGKSYRAGDEAGDEPTEGEMAQVKMRAGDQAGHHPSAGNSIHHKTQVRQLLDQQQDEQERLRRANEPRPGDLVPPKAGSAATQEGVVSFTAKLDSEGNVSEVVYRNGNSSPTHIRKGDKAAQSDEVFRKLQLRMSVVKLYASCCDNDSSTKCQTKVARYSEDSPGEDPGQPVSKRLSGTSSKTGAKKTHSKREPTPEEKERYKKIHINPFGSGPSATQGENSNK